MSILEQIEQRSSALKVNELAEMLQVTPQHIYRLASAGLRKRSRHGFEAVSQKRSGPGDYAWLED